jgi:hypothetical protein
MKLSRILSAFAKNGITVEKSKYSDRTFIASKGGKSLDFYSQDGEYVGYFVERSPHTDSMTDCYCDSYVRTIEGAVRVLNPSGELVRVTPTIPEKVTVENVTITRNMEKGGIEIRFPAKPDQELIDAMKAKGMRYSPYGNLWWCKFSDDMWIWANAFFNQTVTV